MLCEEVYLLNGSGKAGDWHAAGGQVKGYGSIWLHEWDLCVQEDTLLTMSQALITLHSSLPISARDTFHLRCKGLLMPVAIKLM